MRRNTGVVFGIMILFVISTVMICVIRRRSDIVSKTYKDNYNFAFNIDVVSTSKQDKIEFVSAKGKNTEDLDVTFVSDEKYCSVEKGRKMRSILCKCETKSNYTRIDSLRLKINGREKDVKLKVPIENRTRSNIIFVTSSIHLKFSP